MYTDLITLPPYRFYLRIITSSYLRMKMSDTKHILDNLNNITNDEFIKIIQKHYRAPITLPTHQDLILTHQGSFIKILNKFKLTNIHNYLDFGCGNGVISKSVALLLNSMYDGIDIKPNFYNCFVYDGYKLPIINKKYNLITCFQVLHHMTLESIYHVLPQLISLLSEDGYLMIKEHDCYDDNMRLLIELQHLFYDQQHIMSILCLNNIQFWIDLFTFMNLHYIDEYVEFNNPTASCYLLFRNKND